MDISLTNATSDDRAFLIELRKQTMVPHFEQAGLFLSDEEQAFRVDERYECIRIVRYAGTVAGAIKFDDDGTDIEIMQVQILPEFQGKGLGRGLMEKIFVRARQHGKSVRLTVLKQNPARRLYERLGFIVVGEDNHEFHMKWQPD